MSKVFAFSTSSSVSFEEQPPKPDTRVLVLTQSSSATNRAIFALRALVDNWEDASNTLYTTANETLPNLIGVT